MGLNGIERPVPEVKGDPGAVEDGAEVTATEVLVAPRGLVLETEGLESPDDVGTDEA